VFLPRLWLFPHTQVVIFLPLLLVGCLLAGRVVAFILWSGASVRVELLYVCLLACYWYLLPKECPP
jgi:hypothetical protein